ncbi:hypothetical protein [Streptomyces chartreusis]|uniref:hypothetical protein n=1 Tax=Streptomyces chartreusis TaxID=1969 RepID=UPI00381DBC37
MSTNPGLLDTSPSPSPLNTYDGDGSDVQTVAAELRMASKALEETATADIHSHQAMIRSAVVLRIRLNQLVSAVNSERTDRLLLDKAEGGAAS